MNNFAGEHVDEHYGVGLDELEAAAAGFDFDVQPTKTQVAVLSGLVGIVALGASVLFVGALSSLSRKPKP